MIAEVKLDMKNVVSVVVMQDTTVDGNNGLNKVMNNAIQMGFASIRRRFEDMDAVTVGTPSSTVNLNWVKEFCNKLSINDVGLVEIALVSASGKVRMAKIKGNEGYSFYEPEDEELIGLDAVTELVGKLRGPNTVDIKKIAVYHSSKYYQMDIFIPTTHLQFTKNVIAVTDLVADYLNYDVREETAFGFVKEHLKSLSQLGDDVCPVSIKLKSDCETKEVLNLIFKI